MRSYNSLLLTIVLVISWIESHAFVVPTTMSRPVVLMLRLSDENNDGNNDNDSNQKQESIGESLDNLLDKQFFDPEAYGESDTGPLAWFANFVKRDYEFAETVYVGVYLTVLVIVTQEVLRMQLYGDKYMPFTRIGDGNLF